MLVLYLEVLDFAIELECLQWVLHLLEMLAVLELDREWPFSWEWALGVWRVLIAMCFLEMEVGVKNDLKR